MAAVAELSLVPKFSVDASCCLSMLAMQLQFDNRVSDTFVVSDGSFKKVSQKVKISDEVSELRRYLKWNWWAGTEESIKLVHLKIKISLANLWHLGFSCTLRQGNPNDLSEESPEKRVIKIPKMFEEDVDLRGVDSLLLYLQEDYLDPFPWHTLVKITVHLGFTFPDLYRWYTGTYVLYNYRANRGDTYQTKQFDGREDIEYLAEVMKKVTGEEEDLALAIWKKLRET